MKCVIVDRRVSEECQRNLLLHGFFPILLPSYSKMTAAIASHPDSLLFRYKNELVVPTDYCEEALPAFTDLRASCDVRLRFCDVPLGSGFPNDARMNALVMGNKIFCNTKTVSDRILGLAQERGLTICHTSQAYPACSVLALGERYAITSDAGLSRVLSENGISVTLIRSGGIALPPYEYGFIGGASGVYDGKVYFLGDYLSHPDGEIIRSAVLSAGFTPISLSRGALVDLGGMLFFD